MMTEKTHLRYLIVARSELVRSGIMAMLSGIGKCAATFLESESVGDAIARGHDHPSIDLAILGFNAACKCPNDFVTNWQEYFQGVPAIMIAESFDSNVIFDGRNAGVRGFVPIVACRDMLVAAIDLVLAGGVYLPEEVLDHILHRHAPFDDSVDENNEADPANVLTPRQREVLALLARGKSNKEICRELGVSIGTVKNYVAKILRHLAVKNRVQAISRVHHAELAAEEHGVFLRPSWLRTTRACSQ